MNSDSKHTQVQTEIKVQEDDIIDLDLVNIPECLVYEWNSKVKQKFYGDIVDEQSLETVLKWYIQEIKEEGQTFEDYKTLRLVRKNHLTFFKLYFNEINCCFVDNCFDAMEEILALYVDMEVKFESVKLKNAKQRSYKKFAKHIILMLGIYLNYKNSRIYHVLMKLKLNLESGESKTLLNYIYKVFLTKEPTKKSDLNFCRAYILYQKWKVVRKSDDWELMDKIMYTLYNRTPDCIQSNPILKKILPNNLIANTDKHQVITEEYFRYMKFNRTKEDDLIVTSDRSYSEIQDDTVDSVSVVEDQVYEKVNETMSSICVDSKKLEVVHEILDDDIMEIIYLKNKFGKNDSVAVEENLPSSSLEVKVPENSNVEEVPLPTTATASIEVQGKENSLNETSARSVQNMQIDSHESAVESSQTNMITCTVQPDSLSKSELNGILLLSLEPYPTSSQENPIGGIGIQADKNCQDFYSQIVTEYVSKENTISDNCSSLDTEGIDINKTADIPNDLSEFLVAKKTPARYSSLIRTDQNEQAVISSTTAALTDLNLNLCDGEKSDDVQLLFQGYSSNIAQIESIYEIPYSQECLEYSESSKQFGNYEHGTHYNDQQEVYIETHLMVSDKGVGSESGPVHVYLPTIDQVKDLIGIEQANKEHESILAPNLEETIEKTDPNSYEESATVSTDKIVTLSQEDFSQHGKTRERNDCSEFNDIFSGPIPEINQIKNFQGYHYDFFDSKGPEISEESGVTPNISGLKTYEVTNSSDSGILDKGHVEVSIYIQEATPIEGEDTTNMSLENSKTSYLAVTGTTQSGFGTSSLLHNDTHNSIPQLPAQKVDHHSDCIQKTTQQPSIVPQVKEFERIYQSEMFPKKESIHTINTRLPLKKRKMSETRDDNYSCEPVLRIAEVPDPDRNKFKTAAERKEMPSIQETLNFGGQYNDHTYNNSSVNYHMNNVRNTYNINCANSLSRIPVNRLPQNSILLSTRPPQVQHAVPVSQEPVYSSKKTGKREKKRQKR